MSTPEQIEADAALARRLQEEEFGAPGPNMPPFGYRRTPPPPPPPPAAPTSSHPFAPGPFAPSTPASAFSDILRRAAQPPPFGLPSALDGVDNAPSSLAPRAPSRTVRSSDLMLESLLSAAFGTMQAATGSAPPPRPDRPAARARGAPAPPFRAGGFTVGPDGVHRVDFPPPPLQSARPRRDAPNPPVPGRNGRHGPTAHPQRRQPDPDNPHHLHQHYMYHQTRPDGSRRAVDGDLRDVGDMLNDMFSDIFSPFENDNRSQRAPGAHPGAGMGVGGMAGMNGLSDWLRNMLPGSIGEPRQYEDWLEIIDRMGGNVNRGATDEEINRLPTQKFDKQLLERLRIKRRQKEAMAAGASHSAAAAAARSSSQAGPSSGAVEEEAEKCAICLGEYEEGDEVRTLPCYHVFHAECIDRWLKVNKTCPFCKQSIPSGDTPDA